MDATEFIDSDVPGYAVSTGATEIAGILSNEFVELQGIAGTRPVFTVASTDAPAVGATLTINATNYTVRVVEPDGIVLTSLILEQN